MINLETLFSSIWLNNKTVFENVSLNPGFTIQPALSVKTKGAEIDELVIKVKNTNSPDKENNFTTLLKQSRMKSFDKKAFDIPMNFPFDVSDKPFEIRYNKNMDGDAVMIGKAVDENGHGPYSTVVNNNQSRTQSEELINTYYFYSFDGKLLSEFDHNGNCVKDYIYMGNRLIAEYQPQTNKYYYYMTDQINSTRVITDDSGDVVYSEAYGPYGDIQKTWINTYTPKQKFSGKERETYSDLDYFGARYYDHKNYRFNSIDPIINNEGALSNPQLWNLYAYCNNNPISYLDPDGRKLEYAEGSTNEFISQVEHMKSYLKGNSKSASRLLAKLESNKTPTIYIAETSFGNTGYNPKSKKIFISTTEAFKTSFGLIQTPALGFIHECAHALGNLEDSMGYFKRVSIDLKASGYRDMEEFRVITFVETPIAREIPEAIRRYQYDGHPAKVTGPTSVIERRK